MMNSYPYNLYTDSTSDFTEVASYTLNLRRTEFKISYDESKPSFLRYMFNRYFIEHQGQLLIVLNLPHDINYCFKRIFKDPKQYEDYRLNLTHRYIDQRCVQMQLVIYFVSEKLQNLSSFYCNQKVPSVLFSIIHKQSKTPQHKYGLQPIGEKNIALKRDLMLHQKQNLSWLLDRETNAYQKEFSKIPNNYTVCNLPYLTENIVLNWNNRMIAPHSDNWEKSEFKLKGGILADEVGLGKTTSMTALMVAKPVPNTIIVVPARLAIQWESEIKTNTDNLSTIVIGSILRFNKFMADPSKYQVCIVPFRFFDNKSYNKHSLEQNAFRLENFAWDRLIIDESHEILVSNWSLNATQNRMKKKILEIKANYKWLVTGTPGDFHESMKIFWKKDLQIEEYSLYSRELYRHLIRRNTKESAGIELPQVIEENEFLEFSADERAIYDTAFDSRRRRIQLCTHLLVSEHFRNVIGGKPISLEEVREKMKVYYTVELGKVNARLLTAVDPDNIRLFQNQIRTLNSKIQIFDNFQNTNSEDCPICLSDVETRVITTCGHTACKTCIERMFQGRETIKCPMCRNHLRKNQVMVIKQNNQNVEPEENQNKWGTKMSRLIQYLNQIMQDPSARVILVSCWNRMLKLVGNVLVNKAIEHVYLEGSTYTVAKHIDRFKTNKKIRVVMMASDRAASGINLTEGTHIILLDTINSYNAETIEEQAVARSVRMGQKKNVVVKRFVMRNTIEHENFLRLHSQ